MLRTNQLTMGCSLEKCSHQLGGEALLESGGGGVLSYNSITPSIILNLLSSFWDYSAKFMSLFRSHDKKRETLDSKVWVERLRLFCWLREKVIPGNSQILPKISIRKEKICESHNLYIYNWDAWKLTLENHWDVGIWIWEIVKHMPKCNLNAF